MARGTGRLLDVSSLRKDGRGIFKFAVASVIAILLSRKVAWEQSQRDVFLPRSGMQRAGMAATVEAAI
jgi:hypothetical protein